MLTYHDMNPDKNMDSPYNISPSQFAKQLDYLTQKGFHFISMQHFLDFMFDNQPVPPNAVVITFDDGTKSFYRYAYPELKKRKFPATNFIIVKNVDKGRSFSWDQMREMSNDGMSFFSHTYDHHRNTNYGTDQRLLTNPLFLEKEERMETDDEYQARIKADLLLADKRITEELGEQPKLLCFPFGSFNDTVVEIGKQLGIKLFFTVNKGINTKNQRLIYRINSGDNGLDPEELLDLIIHYSKDIS